MRTFLLAAALLLTAPGSAWAQPAAVSAADADEAETFYQRGREHFAEGRTAVASSHFVAAIELDPQHRQARAYLVECLVIEGEVDQARAVALGASPSALPAAREPTAAQRPAAEQPPNTEQPPLPVLTENSVVVAAPELEEEATQTPREPVPLTAPLVGDSNPPAPNPPPESAPTRTHIVVTQATAADTKAARRERTSRLNPRALSKLSGGLALGGAAVTVGGFVELRPSWVGALEIGLGGFLFPYEDRVVSAAAFSIEGQFSPIPFRLTPIFGGGLMVLGGPGVWATDAVLASLPTYGNTRVVPYGVIGARYDLRKRLWVSVSVRLAPSPRTRVMPLPGARIGLRF